MGIENVLLTVHRSCAHSTVKGFTSRPEVFTNPVWYETLLIDVGENKIARFYGCRNT